MEYDKSINTDTPLIGIEHDLLGRKKLIDLIVKSINEIVKDNHQCVVYGIYGKWGEGKSTVLNFIEESLINQGKGDGINLIRFNPWLVDNNEALLHEFFKLLCKDSINDIRDAFQQYGAWAMFLSKAFLPFVGGRVADGIELARNALNDSRPTLAQAKKNVSKAITISRRHLVVMIDDVDRLDKEELHKMLQLVRQVADFDNCIYILAMDAEVVAKSIGHYYGSGSVRDGWNFLEKIIQIPIVLPQVPSSNMALIVQNKLNVILKEYCPAEDINQIAKEVTPFFSTIRELKRYCNQLKFVLPGLQGELNINNLCILEVIKNVSVDAYKRIYHSRSVLMLKVEHELNFDKDKWKEFKPTFDATLDYITEVIEPPLKELVRCTIARLFQIRTFDKLAFGTNKDVYAEAYFPKYFTLLVPDDIIPDTDLDMIISRIKEIDLDDMISIINKWCGLYAYDEITRASLYILNHCETMEDKANAASLISKALSFSSLSTNLTFHLEPLYSFVPNSIIYPYMTINDGSWSIRFVCNEKLLDQTLEEIFQRAELNFCIDLFCSFEKVFSSVLYNTMNTMPIIISRFLSNGFETQLQHSKCSLQSFFKYWKAASVDSFDEYVLSIINKKDYSSLTFIDKLISPPDEVSDVDLFVRIFDTHIPIIIARLKELSTLSALSPSCRMLLEAYRN